MGDNYVLRAFEGKTAYETLSTIADIEAHWEATGQKDALRRKLKEMGIDVWEIPCGRRTFNIRIKVLQSLVVITEEIKSKRIMCN